MSLPEASPFDRQTALLAANCPAYILCGGQSARFGTDKARVRINDQPLLTRLANCLHAQGHATHFVADRSDRYNDLGVECIVDVQPSSGPMAALLAAVQHRAACGPGWCLIVTCDQLHWQHSYFQELANHANSRTDAVTYHEESLQPIPGLYHSRIAPALTKSLARKELSIKRLLESLNQSIVAVRTAYNPREWCFNTDDELQQLTRKLAGLPYF